MGRYVLRRKRSAGKKILASRIIRRHHNLKPALILIMGVAGSGKTTLAKNILRRVCAVYLDNNHIADAFFPGTRNSPKYRKLRSGFYKALYRIAEENLKAGNSVVLDAPHVKEMQSENWHAAVGRLLERTKARLVVIRCRCSASRLRRRIASRGEKRDRWKLAHWREFLAAEPIDVAVRFPHLDIDTKSNPVINAKHAVRYILGSLKTRTRERPISRLN